MIGRALVARLRERGDHVLVLVRRETEAAEERRWDPSTGYLDPAAFAGADAVVNLSGASIAKLPWTRRHRHDILSSRVQATTAIVGALHARADAGEPVGVLVSGSAVGVYGTRPGEELTEESAPGGGFLAEVVRAWEAAALARLGVAGPVGGGRQQWPWISLDDEVRALVHLIDAELTGPVNLAGPEPATAGRVVRAIAADAHRPYWLPAPGFAISGALGEAGRELLLADQCVRPAALTASGFVFRHVTVEDAVAASPR